MAERERKTFTSHFGSASNIIFAIACGAIVIGAFIAKPDGWPYVLAILAVFAGAYIAWLVHASRSNKKADERHAAKKAAKKARNPHMVRCGGAELVIHAGVGPNEPNIPDNLWCGYSVPEWFTRDLLYGEADDDEGEPAPPRCARCRSGKQIRYPKRLETESEYMAYLAKKAESDKASLRDFERLAANLPQRRIEEPANDVASRGVADSHNESAVESESEAEAEKEAGEKEGRRR